MSEACRLRKVKLPWSSKPIGMIFKSQSCLYSESHDISMLEAIYKLSDSPRIAFGLLTFVKKTEHMQPMLTPYRGSLNLLCGIR